MTSGFRLALLWICASFVAIAIGLLPVSAVLIDGQYVPVGPDSFYHARRILDFVADPSGFYQFDAHMHVPEGSVITWPWMYDYTMGLVTRLGMTFAPAGDPMALLVHLPVLAFPLALLAMLALARSLGLGTPMTFLTLLATALFPLSQSLYSVGNIDHHFAEHLFVLGSLAAAAAWFRQPERGSRAVLLGVLLGLAPGVHSALFILQVPVLLSLGLQWLRAAPRPTSTRPFAITLLVTTVAVSLPSLALRNGDFNYYTLSWFQVYAAACTAIAAVILERTQRGVRGGLTLGVTVVAALAPLLGQIALAGDFFTVSVAGMDNISEVQSPLRLWQRHGTPVFVTSLYTGLIWLAPLTLAYCGWRLWSERDAARSHVWLTSILGLTLLLMQLRLQYFGSFALYLPWMILADDLSRRPGRLFAWTPALVAVLLAVAWVPSFRNQLFASHAVAGDGNYTVTHSMYLALRKACAESPGVVLANPNDGHYLRYHTGCSVIGNNFVVTEQHAEKLTEEKRLLTLRAADLLHAAPHVRYIFARSDTMFFSTPEGRLEFMPGDYPGHPNAPLVRELLYAQREQLPPQFELLYQLRSGDQTYARLFAIRQVDAP
jgi:hypothetical protein